MNPLKKMHKTDYHQWLNTALLAVLAFVANKYYDRVETALEMVQQHDKIIALQEQQLSQLKETQDKQSALIVNFSEAILSEPFKRKKGN